MSSLHSILSHCTRGHENRPLNIIIQSRTPSAPLSALFVRLARGIVQRSACTLHNKHRSVSARLAEKLSDTRTHTQQEFYCDILGAHTVQQATAFQCTVAALTLVFGAVNQLTRKSVRIKYGGQSVQGFFASKAIFSNHSNEE